MDGLLRLSGTQPDRLPRREPERASVEHDLRSHQPGRRDVSGPVGSVHSLGLNRRVERADEHQCCDANTEHGFLRADNEQP